MGTSRRRFEFELVTTTGGPEIPGLGVCRHLIGVPVETRHWANWPTTPKRPELPRTEDPTKEATSFPSIQWPTKTGFRVTQRDDEFLRYLAALGVVNRPQAQAWMGLLGSDGDVGPRTCNARLNKLQTAGLLTRERPLENGPLLVFPTRLGARRVGCSGPLFVPGLATISHDLQVGDLALAYVSRGWSWTSDRDLRRLSDRLGYRFRPDGVARRNGDEVAVEVEMTIKATSRWTQILTHHLQCFSRIEYWLAPDVHRSFVQHLNLVLGPVDRERFILRTLGGSSQEALKCAS